jgi:hypothetical protein
MSVRDAAQGLDLPVEGAADAAGAGVLNVGVDQGGAYGTVPQKLLDGADVVAILQEVGGERTSQGMRGHELRDSGGGRGRADGVLDDGLVQVAAADLPVGRNGVGPGRGESPLPDPFVSGG